MLFQDAQELEASPNPKNGDIRVKRTQDKTGNSNAGNITRSFITTWKTTRNNEEIKTPTNRFNATYKYTVDWGDGSVDTRVTRDAIHRYTSPGIYQVEILADQRLVEWIFDTKTWTIFPPPGEFKSNSY